MDKKEMLWNNFMLSGSVGDYLKYSAEKKREEKADESQYGRLDNKGEVIGRAEQNSNGFDA